MRTKGTKMGHLINGTWTEKEQLTEHDENGSYVKQPSRFRNWVTSDGSAGPSGIGGYMAESGRYVLYAATSCPWAHRTVLYRVLKKLENDIRVIDTEQMINGQGWGFIDGNHKVPRSDHTAQWLHEVYTLSNNECTTRVTVPTLWDTKTQTIVSNESSEIIRMFDTAFANVAPPSPILCPDDLRDDIDAMNTFVLHNINDGVNKCGRSTSQEAYNEAFEKLFEALDALEERLGRQRYLVGDKQTEADWRLYPNLIRFDPIYFVGYRCNLRRIVDYPNLSNYLRELYQTPGIPDASDIDGMKAGSFGKSGPIGWDGIIPRGPENRLMQAHDRERFTSLQ
jgi:putative glutathione S-transferase